MKVLNLRCAHQHVFEGWFGSEADYQLQQERGLIECPLCGDKTVARLPSAPRLNLGKDRPAADVPSASVEVPTVVPPPEHALQALWLEAVQHVMAKTDDVGAHFSEEARRIHYGETPERAIRGQATPQEAEALREEGIEVLTLPLPVARKGSLQ